MINKKLKQLAKKRESATAITGSGSRSGSDPDLSKYNLEIGIPNPDFQSRQNLNSDKSQTSIRFLSMPMYLF